MRRVPQVSLVLRDLGVATSVASVMGMALFLRHFGSRVVDMVLAQVSTLVYAAALALTVYTIVDLEFPRAGIIRVDRYDQALVNQRNLMN
jgi:hypothetical protein